jgi:uncharacterized protein YrrD
MLKFASKIIGANILLFQEKAKLGTVKEVVIDPYDGAFLGVLANDPFSKKVKSIPATEIKGMGLGFIMINDLESLSELDEVVKIEKAVNFGAKIFNERVETESGQKLGRVEDFTISLKYQALDKLYVSSGNYVSLFSKELIIELSKIVRIEKKKIIVSDEFVKNTEAKASLNVVPVPEN